MEIFNEITIMCAAYHLFLFTDFWPNVSDQYNVGFSIIVVTTMNIAVNMGVIIVKGVLTLKAKWPKIKLMAINLFRKIKDKLNSKKKAQKYNKQNDRDMDSLRNDEVTKVEII